MTSDKRCIANALNKFFASAATRLMGVLNFSDVPNLRQLSAFVHLNPPFRFEAVSVAFVRAQLRCLKAGKAVGLDNIPARLLKDAADTVAKPLNALLQSGGVPDDWKAARVISLFKKGKAEDMDNYRPISILPVLSKILEGAVHRQLYHHLQQHNILSPYQCGFRKCHSTEFAALLICALMANKLRGFMSSPI